MKRYTIRFTLKDGRITCGHGNAEDEYDAETKATFRLMGIFGDHILKEIASVDTYED